MADGIQDRNITAAFNILDSNGSGVVTDADVEAVARQICGQFGIDPDGDAGRKLVDGFQSWWGQLRADLDTDGDGGVTLAEFAAAYTGESARAVFAEQLGRLAGIVGETIDTDHDGFITEDEFLTVLSVGTDRASALAGFRQMDTDGDGRISVAEYQAGITAVLLSDDPSTPGTAMLGQA